MTSTPDCVQCFCMMSIASMGWYKKEMQLSVRHSSDGFEASRAENTAKLRNDRELCCSKLMLNVDLKHEALSASTGLQSS